MDAALRERVRFRARARCEYCHVSEPFEKSPYCIDHVIAKKHHGPTSFENLALSCYWCNVFKGDNLSGIDPLTGAIVTLFNPRTQSWSEHFRWEGPVLIGQTPEARATIDVLNINAWDRVAIREIMLQEGIHL
jgi:hypothetical protein